MKLLSIECSAKTASCAVSDNGNIICSDFTASPLTHSQTLLPMTKKMLNKNGIKVADIEGFAVSAGPGSFTGIRIGISAVKGMALSRNLPCVGVSTLSAIAYNFKDTNVLVCAVMDARCKQFYNALFRINNGKITRICPDRAISADDLKAEIMKSRVHCPIIIAGDGAELFYPLVKSKKNVVLAEEGKRFQCGEGVALAAEDCLNQGKTVSAEQLLPIYLRLPQAERELKERKGELKK